MKREIVYLIGSLRNPKIPEIGEIIRKAGFEVFDDWFAAGEHADDSWRDYEKGRKKTYDQALRSFAARHTFEFDLHHLNRATMGVLVTPAGKSGHLELGYLSGQEKPTFVLFDGEPERWDCMYQFARGGVHFKVDSLVSAMLYYGKDGLDVC